MVESSGLSRAVAVPIALPSKISPCHRCPNFLPLFSKRNSLRRRGGAVGRVGGTSVGSVMDARSVFSPSFGSRMEDSVRRTVTENPVVIYSKTWCSYSMQVKSVFKRFGVDPLVIELNLLGPQGPQLQKVLERLTGQYTVPNVFIGGRHIGGCTDTVKLHRKGELASLLLASNVGTMSLPQL